MSIYQFPTQSHLLIMSPYRYIWFCIESFDNAFAMPKRKVTDEARDQVARGLSVRGASERAVNQLWNLWHAEDEQIARGSFQRIVDKELQPWKEATINVAFPTYEGGQVVLPIVDLKPTLQRMAHESPAFAAWYWRFDAHFLLR
jgi:hypothetical protein